MTLMMPQTNDQPALAREVTYRERLFDLASRFPADLPEGTLEALAIWGAQIALDDVGEDLVLSRLSPEWRALALEGIDDAARLLAERLGYGPGHVLDRFLRLAGAALFVTDELSWTRPILLQPLNDAEAITVALYVEPELVELVSALASDWSGTVGELLATSRALKRASVRRRALA